jgi:hypothetical protein
VRHQAESGPPDLLHREDDARLAHATGITVVTEGNGPRDGGPFVVVGGMVVDGVIDGAAHGTLPVHVGNDTVYKPTHAD